MTTDFPRQSAKIYQFPRKDPAAAGDDRGESRPAADPRLPRFASTEFGSGWYHEAAVQAERGRRPSIAQ
jgi:hypothetical protein